MCPLCIGTAAWLVSGGTSASGVAALILRRRALKQPPRAAADEPVSQASRQPVSTQPRSVVFTLKSRAASP
jgi:hypothetical protein